MALPRGHRVGAYEILALIGRGATGEVYHARDTRLGRDVALKVLTAAGDTGRGDDRTRFEASGRAAARISHPNLVTTYEVGIDGEVPFVAMELLRGRTLRDVVDEGPLTSARAVDYAVQMADGLAAAHAGGLVHRDLKPGNVFVTTDDRVKLLDFGLARIGPGAREAVKEAGDTVTLPGTVLGTVAYMAPEQVRGLAADHRSDVFACGVVLFEMLSGHRPFAGETPADTMSAVLTADPPRLADAAGRAVPTALARIVARCLEKDPGRRFQSAADLRFALEQLRFTPLEDAAGTPLATDRDSSGRPSPRVWRLAAAGTTVAIIGAIAALMWRERGAPAIDAAPLSRFDVSVPQPSAAPLHVSVSSDGRRLAVGGGRIGTWVHDLSTGLSQRIAETPALGIGAWSPDDTDILVVAEGQLLRTATDGSRSRTLSTVTGFGGADWYGADVIYADGGSIRRVPAAGGPTSVVCESGAEIRDLSGPVVNGSRVFFFAEGRTPAQTGIYVAWLDGACVPRLVTPADSRPVFAPPDRLLFTRRRALVAQVLDPQSMPVGDPIELATDIRDAGRRAVFDASSATLVFRRSGMATTRRLRIVDRSGHDVRELTAPGLYRHPSWSQDGGAVLVNRMGGLADIVSIDVSTGIETPLTSQVPARFGRWSRDRRALAYGEQTADGYALVVKPSRLGSEKRVLYSSKTTVGVHDWSPDGQFILFEHGDVDGEADLFAIRADGTAPPFAVSAERGFDTSGAFSPDGRFVAYAALGFQVFIKSFPGGETLQRVSVGSGLGPRWHPNGREVFFLEAQPTDRGWRLMSVPFDPTGASGAPSIGMPRPLFTTWAYMGGEAPNLGAPYDVSPDGEHFLVLETTGDVVEPISVVLNWSRLLEAPRGPARRPAQR